MATSTDQMAESAMPTVRVLMTFLAYLTAFYLFVFLSSCGSVPATQQQQSAQRVIPTQLPPGVIRIDPVTVVSAATDPQGNQIPIQSKTGYIITTTCHGDCNGDGRVTIGEVQRAVDHFLGKPLCDPVEPELSCPDADVNGDGIVSIGEVINSIHKMFEGCG